MLVNMEITDLSPKFLKFYDSVAGESDQNRIWERWKAEYDFAALPPIPERDALAKQMLFDAWEAYPTVMDRIRQPVDSVQPNPQQVLEQVVDLLELTEPITCNVLFYVGAMESNAFVAPTASGHPCVCFPKEQDASWLEIVMPHEFAHVVHAKCANLKVEWERPLAEAIFAEGLAMWTGSTLVPNRLIEDHVEHRPGWLAECRRNHHDIMAHIAPHLRDSSSDILARYLLPSGGQDRQGYYAGWVLFDKLTQAGQTLAQLAHIPEDHIVELVMETLSTM